MGLQHTDTGTRDGAVTIYGVTQLGRLSWALQRTPFYGDDMSELCLSSLFRARDFLRLRGWRNHVNFFVVAIFCIGALWGL